MIPDPVTRYTLNQETFAFRYAVSDFLHIPNENLDMQTYYDDLRSTIYHELKLRVWVDRLPPQKYETETGLTVPVYNSAWQLWKANHRNSKLFGWFVRRYPPVKTGIETHKATASVNLDRKVLFPAANYPASLGKPYLQVADIRPGWTWHD